MDALDAELREALYPSGWRDRLLTGAGIVFWLLVTFVLCGAAVLLHRLFT